MTDALTILITGGIGSGKSALTSYLSERGVPVYDSDSRTKALYDGELGTMVAMPSVLRSFPVGTVPRYEVI